MGGVILEVDYRKIFQEFANFGCKDMHSFFTQQTQIPLVDDFEKGLLSARQFRQGVRKLVNMDLEDKDIDCIWNSMVIGVRKKDMLLLNELKKKYDKIFLFSNTNEIHMKYVKLMFWEAMGYEVFGIFDKVYLSNEIHLRKPDMESFDFVVKDAGVQKSETLFIDDTKQNILGAKRAGLNTYLLDNNQTLFQIYNQGII